MAKRAQFIVNIKKKYHSSVYCKPLYHPCLKPNNVYTISYIFGLNIFYINIFNDIINISLYLYTSPDNLS